MCSATGQVYLDRPDGRGIYHLNRDFLAAHRRTPPASAPEAAARLRRALGPMPALDATPIRPRYFAPRHEPPVESAAGVSTQQVYFWSEPGVAVAGTLLRPAGAPGPPAAGPPGPPAWLVLLPHGTASPVAGPGRRHRPRPGRRAGARLRPPRARGGQGGAADRLRPLRHPPGPRGVVQLRRDPDRPLHARLARLRRAARGVVPRALRGRGRPGGHPRPRHRGAVGLPRRRAGRARPRRPPDRHAPFLGGAGRDAPLRLRGHHGRAWRCRACCSTSTCPTCASASPAGSWCWTYRCPSPPSRSSCPSPATDGGRRSRRGEASPGTGVRRSRLPGRAVMSGSR